MVIIVKNSNKILILLKNTENLMKKVFEYNFNNADVMLIPENYTPFDRERLAENINKNYDQVIFFDYYDQFYLLLPLISKKVIKKYIINNGIALLYNEYILNNMMQLYEYKERNMIDYIATTKYDTYVSMKDKIEYIELDYKTKIHPKNNNSIGLLGLYYFEYSNFFVQLSAVAMSKINKAVVLEQSPVVKKFGEDFNVAIKEEKDINKLIEQNKVNLDVAFSEVSTIKFLISMDAGIPCIIGNTNLLDNDEKLKKLLVPDSDDDVNEICEKIENVLAKKKEIEKLYSTWRKKYSDNSKNLVKNFIKLGGGR